jgi:hypothetical protein
VGIMRGPNSEAEQLWRCTQDVRHLRCVCGTVSKGKALRRTHSNSYEQDNARHSQNCTTKPLSIGSGLSTLIFAWLAPIVSVFVGLRAAVV